MGKTPNPPKGQNVDTMTYPAPGKHTTIGHASITYPGQQASTINPFSYGGNSGKANAQTGNVPSVQVGGSFEVGTLPAAFDGDFGIGDDKDVSTPVSG